MLGGFGQMYLTGTGTVLFKHKLNTFYSDRPFRWRERKSAAITRAILSD